MSSEEVSQRPLLSVPFQHRSAPSLSCSVLSSPPRPLGQLLLLLQLQPAAGRIKVLLRKAQALGRLSRLPGTPGRARAPECAQGTPGTASPPFAWQILSFPFILLSSKHWECWNEMIFGVPSNPNHSVIVSLDENEHRECNTDLGISNMAPKCLKYIYLWSKINMWLSVLVAVVTSGSPCSLGRELRILEVLALQKGETGETSGALCSSHSSTETHGGPAAPQATLGSCQPPSLACAPLSRALSPFPGHYVIVHLHHEGHIIDTKETKSVSGYSPVWNAPFLFTLPAGDIQQQQLALEFVVMQVR